MKTYEKEFELFMNRTKKERHALFDKILSAKTGSPELRMLSRELHLLYRKHVKELNELNARYNLPPLKVIDNSKVDLIERSTH